MPSEVHGSSGIWGQAALTMAASEMGPLIERFCPYRQRQQQVGC